MDAWHNVRSAVLAELRPDLSPRLVEWVCSLLSLDPSQRPVSAVEAGSTLAALHPPPPMVPPEVIRPRPAPKSLPAPPPVSSPHKPSSFVPPPIASGIRAPAAKDDLNAVPVPRITPVVSRPSPLPTLIIYAALIIVVACGMLWVLTRPPEKTAQEQTAPSPREPARPPAPSVPVAPAPVRPPPDFSAPIVLGDTGPLIASETFKYPAGQNIKGKSGGRGWDGAWQGLVGKVAAPSLSYLNHPATDGSLFIPEVQQPLELNRLVGPLSRFIADPLKGGHWYVGLLVQHSNSTPEPGGAVIINPLDMADVNDLVRIVVEDRDGAQRINLNADEQGVTVPQDGKPLFLILRIDLNNPKDGRYDIKGTLWVSPDLASAKPDQTGQKLSVELKNQPVPRQLGLLVRKKPGKTVTFIDEVRYARRMADMVFKPAAEETEAGP